MAFVCKHGVVCTRPGSQYGYFGWPSAAILGDGRVVVGCSGLRRHHVDPFGKTVLCVGTPKDGFGECIVGHDSPLDDRDAGVVALGGNSLLVTWFTLDTRIFRDDLMKYSPAEFEVMDAAMRAFPEDAKKYVGSWTMRSDDGGATFTSPARCPVSSPHGPIVMRDGRLIYLGKLFPEGMDRPFGIVSCAESRDGLHWDVLGEVPLPENVTNGQFHEPHVIELNDGALLCLIRYHYTNGDLGIYKSVSRDGGRTWSTPEDMDTHGSPPHLLRHSSGAIVLTYSWRHTPYGQRARISRDDGATWSDEIILRDDGPDGDLGYPCSVELPGGDILTVYYQKRPGESLCSILWTQWRI